MFAVAAIAAVLGVYRPFGMLGVVPALISAVYIAGFALAGSRDVKRLFRAAAVGAACGIVLAAIWCASNWQLAHIYGIYTTICFGGTGGWLIGSWIGLFREIVEEGKFDQRPPARKNESPAVKKAAPADFPFR